MNDLNNKIEIASKLITESKKVIVMTGAGISVDSGVPTAKELKAYGQDLENLK